jgi:hypothetical protein
VLERNATENQLTASPKGSKVKLVVAVGAALGLGIAGTLSFVMSTNGTSNRNTRVHFQEAAQTTTQWVMTNSQYEAWLGQNRPKSTNTQVTAPTSPPSSIKGPAVTPNGPQSLALESSASTTNALPAGATVSSAQDVAQTSGSAVAQVLYSLPSGQTFRITRQQLQEPIDENAITGGTTLDQVTTLSNGATEIVVNHGEPFTGQVVQISSSGLLINVVTTYLPSAEGAASSSVASFGITQMESIANALDS